MRGMSHKQLRQTASQEIEVDKLVSEFYEKYFGKERKWAELTLEEKEVLENIFIYGFQYAHKVQGIDFQCEFRKR